MGVGLRKRSAPTHGAHSRHSVLGFIPSSAAAASLPYTWPLHYRKARSILARSSSLISVTVKTGVASSSARPAVGFCGSRRLTEASHKVRCQRAENPVFTEKSVPGARTDVASQTVCGHASCDNHFDPAFGELSHL